MNIIFKMNRYFNYLRNDKSKIPTRTATDKRKAMLGGGSTYCR